MFKCPVCGAEHTELPEHCEHCGAPFVPDFDDPFAAAMEQEARSREEQEKMRKKYRKQIPDAPAALPAPAVSAPQAPPAQKSASKSGKRKKQRKTELTLTVVAITVIILLTVYAVVTLPKGIRTRNESLSDNSYAFYQKANSLWFYDGRVGEQICLVDHAADIFLTDDTRASERMLASLMCVSEDGSRIYYPKASYHSGTALLCWRSLDDAETECTVAEISLEGINPLMTEMHTALEPGNPAQQRAEDFVNMLPAYILLGDTLFYRNREGMLCRQEPGGAETVLPTVARFWTVPDSDLVYYLVPQLDIDTYEYDIATTEICGSFQENCTVPCMLWYCGADGAPTACEPSDIRAWAVPESDSARWFHYTTYFSVDTRVTDEEITRLWQRDLLHPERAEAIAGELKKSVMQVLRCYPDGSFFYSTAKAESPEGAYIYFFKRSFDQWKFLAGVDPNFPAGQCAVCRAEPYFIAQTQDGQTKLFYGRDTVAYTPAEEKAEASYSFAYGGTELYCKYREREGQPFDEALYIGKPNGEEPFAMRPVEDYDAGAVYFALSDESSTQYFSWNTEGENRLTACYASGSEQETVTGVRLYMNSESVLLCPQYGQLYCLSDYFYSSGGALYRFQDGSFSAIAGGIESYIPLDAKRLYLFGKQTGELKLRYYSATVTADTDVTALFCAGNYGAE